MRTFLGNERSRLVAVLVVVLLTGIVLVLATMAGQEGEPWPWRDFLRDVGVALIIASVVGLALERYLRETLYTEISGHISDSLEAHRRESIDAIHFQRTLPAEISEVVRRTIVEEPFLERDIAYHYEMGPVDVKGEKLLRAEITGMSTVENLADETRTLRYQEWTGIGVIGGDDAGYTEVGIEGVSDNFRESWKLLGDNIQPYLYYQRGYMIFARDITLPAGARVRTFSKEIKYYHMVDTADVCCVRPTINFQVTVHVAGGPFDFSGEPSHPLDTYFSSSVDNDAGIHCWKISGGLTPNQGIVFQWSPRTPGPDPDIAKADPDRDREGDMP